MYWSQRMMQDMSMFEKQSQLTTQFEQRYLSMCRAVPSRQRGRRFDDRADRPREELGRRLRRELHRVTHRVPRASMRKKIERVEECATRFARVELPRRTLARPRDDDVAMRRPSRDRSRSSRSSASRRRRTPHAERANKIRARARALRRTHSTRWSSDMRASTYDFIGPTRRACSSTAATNKSSREGKCCRIERTATLARFAI